MKKWNRPEVEVLDINETANGGKADRYEGNQGNYGNEKAPNGKPYHPHGDLSFVAETIEGDPENDHS